MSNDKIQPTNSQFILYQDDNGVTNVDVRFDGSDVWLSQQQIALLFDTSRENVVQHISNIYQEAELQQEGTCKNFLQVQMEGNRSVKRNIPNYNLDMIIAIGYRVKSQVATHSEHSRGIYTLIVNNLGLTMADSDLAMADFQFSTPLRSGRNDVLRFP